MLTKALEKLAERLVAYFEARPYGVAVLALIGIIGGAFILLQHLRSTPAAVETLRDPIFQTVAVVAIPFVAIILVWRTLGMRRSAKVVSTALALAATSVGTWYVNLDTSPTFKIDLVFDNGTTIDRSLIATFFSDVQQDHITVTLRKASLLPPSTESSISFEVAQAVALPKLRPRPYTTHTILVTDKILSGGGWSNAFYVAGDRFAIISTRAVIDSSSMSDRVLARKYLASMVPLAALDSQAHSQNITLLRERSPSTEHGCLHDFNVDRALLLEKLKQGPALCKAEADAIARTFGRAVASEYKVILGRAAR